MIAQALNRNTRKFLLLVLLWLIPALSALAGTPTVTYIYTDPQGTPLAETDAQGNVTATFDYRPYGSQALGTPPKGPGYTGHVNDPDTGLVYMQARYYDPEMGRFLSVDPLTSTSAGRYQYANDNPYRYVDPDGRQATDPPCTAECHQQREAQKQAQYNYMWGGGSSGLSDSSGHAATPSVIGSKNSKAKADNSKTKADGEPSGLSVSGLVVGKPSVSATGIAAYGTGFEAVKGLYKEEDSVGIITPALGLSASADVKIFQITYRGANAGEGPVVLTSGGEFSFHDILGVRISGGYSPPSTFQFSINGGAGAGAAFHIFSVAHKIN
jgi:RHS repeat-associated protein